MVVTAKDDRRERLHVGERPAVIGREDVVSVQLDGDELDIVRERLGHVSKTGRIVSLHGPDAVAAWDVVVAALRDPESYAARAEAAAEEAERFARSIVVDAEDAERVCACAGAWSCTSAAFARLAEMEARLAAIRRGEDDR